MLTLPYYPGLYTAPRHHLPAHHDTLEVDGPVDFVTPQVNYVPGSFILAGGSVFADPGGPPVSSERPPYLIIEDTAARMWRLLRQMRGMDEQTRDQVEELKWRLKILHPYCDEQV